MVRAVVLVLVLVLVLVQGGPPGVAAGRPDESSGGPLSDEERYDPVLNDALEKFMNLVSHHRVVIVGKKGCEMTDRVTAAFADLHESPHMIYADGTFMDGGTLVKNALRRWLGYWITPQVFVDGMHYGGAELTLENYRTGLLAKDLKDIKTDL